MITMCSPAWLNFKVPVFASLPLVWVTTQVGKLECGETQVRFAQERFIRVISQAIKPSAWVIRQASGIMPHKIYTLPFCLNFDR